jgi:hypothetical protein
MDTSDVSKPASQMLTTEPGEKTLFFVIQKTTGTL